MLEVADGAVHLRINLRRPRGRSAEQYRASLTRALEALQTRHGSELAERPGTYVGDPHFVDPAGETVQTLISVYRELTGDTDAMPVSSRGSTYARLIPGAASFGPSLPDRPYRGHGADEFMWLDALDLQLRALWEATVRLR